MGCTLHLAWDDRLAGYDFGAGHPMAPVRVELTIELARAFGLFLEPGVSVEPPAPATDEDLGGARGVRVGQSVLADFA
jgi:acetoin utilization protein AcuC